MNSTKQLAKHLRETGVSLAHVARTTGIPYDAIYNSLSENGTRDLRADEFLTICIKHGLDPLQFKPQKKVSS